MLNRSDYVKLSIWQNKKIKFMKKLPSFKNIRVDDFFVIFWTKDFL